MDRRHADDEQIRRYLDGRQFFQVSVAMGGGFPDGVCGCTTPTDQTTSGGTMTVRHVAVYERRHTNR